MFFLICLSIGVVFCIFLIVLKLSLEKKIVYKSLKNKHVVVTGGSSGIGKAVAIEAAKLGAHVTIIGRDLSKLILAVSDVTSHCAPYSGQKIQYASLDVTSDYESIQTCLYKLEANVGPIFMLVNCAGMCICGQFDQMKVEEIKQMIDLNYFGTAYPTKYVLSGMKKRNEGLIVFVSTEAALLGIYGYSAYGAAKWAVRGLAESIFMELVGTNVRLMLAFPPDTDTPGFKSEEITKPKETKLISGSGGLHRPEDVGKKLIQDALVILLACVTVAVQAGGLIAPASYYGSYTYGGWNPYSSYPAQPAIATQQSNILRTPFNLGQVSTYSKAIDTPFSSVRKADIRVSNPGVAIAPAYSGVATPLVSHVAAPRVAAGLLGVAYSAAPAVSHMTYTNGLGLAYAW